LAEETVDVETSEVETPDAPISGGNSVVDLDQKIRIGGEEFSASEITEAYKNYN